MQNFYLFSIDLEDVRENVNNGFIYEDRVVENTRKYINWLSKINAKCTFFVVGRVAERHPDLIREIIDSGHEIACHSYKHWTIDKMSPDEFRIDLEKNIHFLSKAGANQINGFRAPVFSLTDDTSWAYDELIKLGFTYSSSVLPAKNPLFGWDGFGNAPKIVKNNFWELPISLNNSKFLKVPLYGGIYFRVLPYFYIKYCIKKNLSNYESIFSYFHPYDIDNKQEKFMHDGINNNIFLNYLMYYNRNNVLDKLNNFINDFNLKITTYSSYIENKL